ncbi:MAG: GNAT family N-acetyltransferase [Pseudomonadota bacterium]
MLIGSVFSSDYTNISKLHGLSFPKPWSEKDIADLLEAPHIYGMKYSDASDILGCLIFSVIADEAEIYSLFVHPSHRQKHIASDILNAFHADIEARLVTRCVLEVSEENKAAQKLYAKSGYHIFHRREKYYNDDGVYSDALMLEKNF